MNPEDEFAEFVRNLTPSDGERDVVRFLPSHRGYVVQQWFGYIKDVRRLQPQTIRSYRSVMSQYMDFLDKTHPLHATVPQMDAFCTRPRVRRGAGTNGADASVKNNVFVLRSFYRWCWEQKITKDFLANALHGPTVHNTNPRPLTDEQWTALWLYPLNDQDRAFLGLGFFVGLRRSEMVELRTNNWTRDAIVNFTRKGGGEHTVPIRMMLKVFETRLPALVGDPSWLQDSLDSMVAASVSQRRERILSMGTTGRQLNGRLLRLCGKVGIDPVTPHQLRHSAVSNLLRAGVPIQLVCNLMNHSSIEITMRYVKAAGHELGDWLGGNYG